MSNGLLHHLEYFVDDLERTQEFWGWLFPLLGWAPKGSWSDGVDWVHPSGTYFGFVRTEKRHRNVANNRHGLGFNHIAFQCDGSTSQKDFVALLSGKGAKILYDDPGYLCFEDPNQFAVELYF